MREFPRTTTALRAALQEAGLSPRRRRGQCFLTDVQAMAAIVRDAGVVPGDHVIEVGTGPGSLTHALVEAGATVDTFEVDGGLLAFARSARDWPSGVRFHHQDVLEGKRRLAPGLVAALSQSPGSPQGRRLLVSNLPYAIATPLLTGVLWHSPGCHSIAVMVQVDVAEKLLAPVSGREYGAPSVLVQLRAQGRIARRFPPEVFWPRPRVHSALLLLFPRAEPALSPVSVESLGRFMTGVFSRRRKVLATAVAHAAGVSVQRAAEALGALGLSAGVRPQEVAPGQFLDLWLHMGAAGLAGGGGQR